MATITEIDVMSLAKLHAVLNGLIGAIMGIVLALIALVKNPILAVVLLIGVPIGFAILGFVSGAISALLFNLAVGWSGGLKIDLEK